MFRCPVTFFTKASTASSSSSSTSSNVENHIQSKHPKYLPSTFGGDYKKIYRPTDEDIALLKEGLPSLYLAKFLIFEPNKHPPQKLTLGRGRFSQARVVLYTNANGERQYFALRKIKAEKDLSGDIKDKLTKRVLTKQELRANVIQSTMNELRLQNLLREKLNCNRFALAHEVLAEYGNDTSDIVQLNQIVTLADIGNGLDFLRRIQNLPLEQRATVLTYVSNILILEMTELNAAGFFMRDLKVENLLFASNGEVLISDFGSATYYENGVPIQTTTYLTHVKYAPPFTLFNKATDYDKDVLHDQWSLGLALLEMWIDCPLMPCIAKLQSLITQYKDNVSNFAAQPALRQQLLEQYQSYLNTLKADPVWQTIPRHIHAILFATLEMDMTKRKATLVEMVEPHLAELTMPESFIAAAKALFRPQPHIAREKSTSPTANGLKTVSSYYELARYDEGLPGSTPERSSSATPKALYPERSSSATPKALYPERSSSAAPKITHQEHAISQPTRNF